MDQIKIGRFIAARRKEKGLTQLQLAEKMSVTDRAVSKWERGQCLPDTSIMQELCRELGISVNDLLNGEIVDMEKYNEKNQEQLLELLKEKEISTKRMLGFELVIGFMSMIILFSFVFVAAFIPMQDWQRIVLIVCGMVFGFVGIFFALRAEQIAGYYECGKCHYKYVPTYKSVVWAMHSGRTRYMKCPRCNQKSWQKKVINKD